MAKKINLQLTKEEIENKEFMVAVKGYKAEEVDSFLDLISDDYRKVQEALKERDKIIENLNGKIESQESEIDKLRNTNAKLSANLSALSNATMTNANVIKALNENKNINLSDAINKSK